MDLKIWSTSLFGGARIQFHVANEVIFRLDVAQEHKQLSAVEIELRKKLKQRVLGLAAIERARKKHAS